MKMMISFWTWEFRGFALYPYDPKKAYHENEQEMEYKVSDRTIFDNRNLQPTTPATAGPRNQITNFTVIGSETLRASQCCRFSIYCPHFQLRMDQRKPNRLQTNYIRWPASSKTHLQFSCMPAPSNQNITCRLLLLFLQKRFLHFCLYWLPNTSNGGWHPCYGKLWMNSLCCSLFAWLFHSFS